MQQKNCKNDTWINAILNIFLMQILQFSFLIFFLSDLKNEICHEQY